MFKVPPHTGPEITLDISDAAPYDVSQVGLKFNGFPIYLIDFCQQSGYSYAVHQVRDDLIMFQIVDQSYFKTVWGFITCNYDRPNRQREQQPRQRSANRFR